MSAHMKSSTNTSLRRDFASANCMSKKYGKILCNSSVNLNKVIASLSRPSLKKVIQTPTNLGEISITEETYRVDPKIHYASSLRLAYPPKPSEPLPHNKRNILIVGGYKGLGEITAKYLSSNGFKVIVTSSQPQCYDHMDGRYIKSEVPLDVRSQESIDNFISKEIKPLRKLDGLILFPGIHSAGSLIDYSTEDIISGLMVKPIGAHGLIQKLEPFLRRGDSPRVIGIGSILGMTELYSIFDGLYSVGNTMIDSMFKFYRLCEGMKIQRGEVNNPIYYSVVAPQLILSTIGLFQFLKPSNLDVLSDEVNFQHILISAYQSGLIPSWLPDDPIFVARDMYNILTAKVPGMRYLSGDPESRIFISQEKSLTIIEYLEILSNMDPDTLINSTIFRTASPYNDKTISKLRKSLYNYYFG